MSPMSKKTKKDKEERDWLTVHLPLKKSLVELVDEQATAERRSRVNMLTLLVELALTSRRSIEAKEGVQTS